MNDSRTKTLLSCAAIGFLVFVSIFLLEGIVRAGYNPLRHPISSLSIGEWGWMQQLNFMITGSLVIAFAIGLGSALRNQKGGKWTPRLVGMVGAGLIGAGIFSTDPVYGYPTDQPMVLAQFSTHGHLHDFFSIFVFICLPIACFKMRRYFASVNKPGWALYSVVTAIAMLAFFILAGAGFKQTPGVLEFAGVFQRLSLIIGGLWMSLLGIYLRKTIAPR